MIAQPKRIESQSERTKLKKKTKHNLHETVIYLPVIASINYILMKVVEVRCVLMDFIF